MSLDEAKEVFRTCNVLPFSCTVAEDLGPTATATVAEVLGHSYGRRFLLVVFLGFSKLEAEMCFSLHMCHLRLMWMMIVLSLKIKTGPF